jgi:hypothetical protein
MARRLRLFELVAAEQERPAEAAHQAAHDRALGVLLEIKRRGRLGPHDELRAVGGRLLGELQIPIDDHAGAGRVPLVGLGDIALDQPDLDRRAAGELVARQPHAAPDRDQCNRTQCGPRGHDPNVSLRGRRRRQRYDRKADIHERDKHREPVHAESAGELRDRQQCDHRVAERDPWEAAQDDAAEVFRRDPHHGHETETADAEMPDEDRANRARDGNVGRHIERQQRGDDHGHEHRQAAERRHGGAGPVNRAGEVDEAGDQAQRESAARRDARERDAAPTPAADGDE